MRDIFTIRGAHKNITTIKSKGASAQHAKELGFAKYNDCPHLCIDLPDHFSTITVRTTAGDLITFAFGSYSEDGPPRCVDIIHHNAGKTVKNGDRDVPTFNICLGSIGAPVAVGRDDGEKPVTCAVLTMPEVPAKEQVRRLVESGRVHPTLNSKPARITGYENTVATIINETGYIAQEWDSVLQFLKKDHKFFT